jgi:tripartite-type tricarboxylate transporter receptor subunit TctC
MVRFIVPFGAGSNTDAQARIIAEKLRDVWGQQVIVENRPGVVGTATAAKATPDGHTLMLTSSGHIVAHVIHENPGFHPVKDFAGVTQVTTVPAALVVPPDLPAKNVKEFIALAKEKPGALNFSSAGRASTSYLAGEIFKQTAGIELVHIPYKGAPDAMTSIMRGDSHIYFASATFSPDLIASGKISVLAVSSAERSPLFPDIPTVRESGLPDYVYDSWFGVMAPAGVPGPILNKISADIAKVLRMPDVAAMMKKQGLLVVTQTPDEFSAMMKSESERFSKILREAGVGRK